MTFQGRRLAVVAAILLASQVSGAQGSLGGKPAEAAAPSNQSGLSNQSGSSANALRLNLVTTGASADGLQQGEVTLLDNGAPANVQSLQPVSGREPTHVILVIDDVNARLTTVAYERDQLKKFFAKNEGQLSVPFTIAVMTDTKTDIQAGFSQSGAAENDALQKYKIGLHEITRSSQYGGLDRTNIGVRALEQLVHYAGGLPGHKLLLFVSPGWPLLSGPRIQLPAKDENSIFETVARLQDSMLQSDITLDMLNPFGPAESPLRSDYYMAFMKGVSKPSEVDLADLSLQVLATHSGGSVQQGSSDIEGMVERSVGDLNHRYTLAFVPGQSEKPLAYHSLKLQVNRPGVTVRMPDEYYARVPTNGADAR